MKNLILYIILSFSITAFAQEKKQSAYVQDEIIDSIELFLINEKQIHEKNSVKLVIADIIDGKKLSEKVKGVFIVRTGTHKHEYLLFKNNNEFSIVKFDSLKPILVNAVKLFHESNDLLIYSKELLLRYEENKPNKPKFIPN